MYKGKFVVELSMNEVKEYYDELRQKYPLTEEQRADFNILKEKLVAFAYKALEQEPVLDKIRTEIKEESRFCPLTEGLERALEIIDKYAAEREESEERER